MIARAIFATGPRIAEVYKRRHLLSFGDLGELGGLINPIAHDIAMFPIGETINDFDAGRERIRARRYGVIEIAGGSLSAVHLRPWPKLFSLSELWPVAFRYHARGEADRCLLYYNQSLRQPNFIALKYVVSTAGTSYRTFRAALVVLDAIAELKRTDAILCDAANLRISDRLLARLGWQAHKPQRWHRNFIRRFYGNYPAAALPR